MAKKKKTKVEEIIEKSGNGFHTQVVKLLRENHWNVLVSPYYSDNFTDKPREIDIISEKKFDVYDFSEWLGTVDIHLFIECKYINGVTVFWFDSKDKNRAVKRIMIDTGMDHPNRNININEHHYLKDTNISVAKLFTSEKSRNEDSELMNKAINQNLNALIYYRNRRDIFPKNESTANKTLKQLPYPLIVVNSFENFFRVDISDDTEKIEPITEPFQLEVNYAYIDNNTFIDEHRGDARNEYFLIDVVSFDKLSEFLSMLEKTDIAKVKEKVSFEQMRINSEQRNIQENNNDFFAM